MAKTFEIFIFYLSIMACLSTSHGQRKKCQPCLLPYTYCFYYKLGFDAGEKINNGDVVEGSTDIPVALLGGLNGFTRGLATGLFPSLNSPSNSSSGNSVFDRGYSDAFTVGNTTTAQIRKGDILAGLEDVIKGIYLGISSFITGIVEGVLGRPCDPNSLGKFLSIVPALLQL